MARKPAPPGSDRRQQILEAALDLFSEQGLKGATSKDIAERAEVTHGLIYFYFTSKEELFKAAFDYALDRALVRLDVAALAQSEDSPEEALTCLMMRFLEALTSPRMRNMSRLMMHTMAHKDWQSGPLYECKAHMHSTIKSIVNEVRVYLDRQVALGRLRSVNTENVARFLVGGVGSSVRWAQSEGRTDIDTKQAAADIVDVCMRGLLPQLDTLADAQPETTHLGQTERAESSTEQVVALAEN